MRSLDLIHYGADKYLPEQFLPVQDQDWIKPLGGLWTSPVGSEWGWADWCMAEDYKVRNLARSFRLRFEGRVFVIDSVPDMMKLPWSKPFVSGLRYPSFERLIKDGYDAIWLTVRGQEATRWTHPESLYGWDCESVLIMNRALIRAI